MKELPMKEYHVTKDEYRKFPIKDKDGKYIVKDIGTFYYKDNLLHREDGPAEEFDNGNKYWYLNGREHRLDGPAIELNHVGDEAYYIHGEYYDSKEEYEIAAYLYKNQLENYK